MKFAEFLQDSEVNRALETLDTKISKCYNQCCPIETKIISVKDQSKPLITRPLKQKGKKGMIIFFIQTKFN